MSDAAALARSLTVIDQAALAAILEPQNHARRDALCRLIADHKGIVAADYQLGDMDSWRLKTLGIFEEILSASDAARRTAEPQRARLIVSYLRTMRSFIAKLLPLLPVAKPVRQ
jgi:hypothetical protein